MDQGDERAVSHQVEPSRTCWGFEDDEELQNDPDDVMEYWLDSCHPTPLDELPETVTILEYGPRTIDTDDSDAVLERYLEGLDEEYGNPERDGDTPTPAMKAAAAAFVAAVNAEYEVWQCVPTGRSETVNVLQWVKENAPEWLEEKA